MKVGVIIQARMGSTRLPGKILKKVLNKPLLQFQLERIKSCNNVDEIIVATTTKPYDVQLVEFCRNMNVKSYQGSEEDVLQRYYGAAEKFDIDLIVRVTSDCPLIDPTIIDKVIQTYKDNPIYDYLSNTLQRSYPRGMDVSVVPFPTLKFIHEKAKDLPDREHVTKYLYDRPSEFTLGNVGNDIDYSEHRWTVDTEEDFELIKNILEEIYPQNKDFKMQDIINVLNKYPQWKEINAHIEQKKV